MSKQIYSWDLSLAKDILQDWVFDRPLVRGPCAGVTCLGALTPGRCKAHTVQRPGLHCLLTGRGRAPSPLSADKLHSCGVTCQHLHCGSPETNQECSACQTVALSHYIETTFLREPWALSEQEEWGIHWHSAPQPCNERQHTVVRPALQLKEKVSCKKSAKSMHHLLRRYYTDLKQLTWHLDKVGETICSWSLRYAFINIRGQPEII